MAAGLRRLLLEQTDMVWQQAHQCVDGLTDEEFFWEPAPGCWSLRRRSQLTVDVAPAELAVPGDWICEHIGGNPQPPPLTTIVWRVTHTMLAVWSYIDDIVPLRDAARARTAAHRRDRGPRSGRTCSRSTEPRSRATTTRNSPRRFPPGTSN